MIKEGSENIPALSFIKQIPKNITFHWTKTIENGGKSHYEINVFSQIHIGHTIIGTPIHSYEENISEVYSHSYFTILNTPVWLYNYPVMASCFTEIYTH